MRAVGCHRETICSFGSELILHSTLSSPLSFLLITPSCQEGSEELQRSGLSQAEYILGSLRFMFFCCGFTALTSRSHLLLCGESSESLGQSLA